MKRRSLTSLQRLKIFEDNGGICYLCEEKIQVGQPWEIEHMIPLALGGPDTEANMLLAHRVCHAPKTVEDMGRIAKAKRQSARHHGAKQSRWPKSKWKRKVSGETVLR